MNSNNLKQLQFRNICLTALTLFLAMQITCVNAQEQRVFKSKSFAYTKDVIGDVSYGYILIDLDTILNGSFSFKSIEDVLDIDYQYKTTILQGDFSNNQKINNWQFIERKLVESSNPEVSDYNITIATNGVEKKVSANFSNGFANGRWQVGNFEFNNARITDTISNLEANYKNGLLHDTFNFFSKESNITGFFDEEGFFDGEWKYEHSNNIIEIRKFKKGFIEEISFEIGEKNIILENLIQVDEFSEQAEHKSIPLSNTFFEVLNLILPYSHEFKEEYPISTIDSLLRSSNQLTLKSIQTLGIHNGSNIWDLPIQKQPLHYGSFKLNKYVISSQDSVFINNIKSKFKKINDDIDFFTSHPKIKIRSASNNQVARIEAIYDVYRSSSPELNHLIKILSSNNLQYVNLDAFIDKFLSRVKFRENPSYQFQDTLVMLDRNFPSLETNQDLGLLEFSNFTDAIFDDINRQNELVKIILSDSEKLEIIEELENEFYNKANEVINLFSNAKLYEDYNAFHKKLNPIILGHTQDLLKLYESSNVNDKKDQITENIKCFESYIQFWDDLVWINEHHNNLDQDFSRIVFNPFLMDNIKERLKEKIYKAYEEYLLPYLLNIDTLNNPCEEVLLIKQNFEVVYNRMMEIKEIDTKQEELLLRRQREPSKILEILNITLN